MVFKRGDTWYADYTDEAGVRQRPALPAQSKREAEVQETELKDKVRRAKLGLEVRTRNPSKHTVLSLVGWWLTSHAKKQKNGSRVTATLKKHVTGKFARLPIEMVQPAHVTAWLSEREDAGLSAASVNRLRSYLMGVFSRAREAGLLVGGENPVKGTRMRATERKLPRALPPECVLPVIEHAPEEFRLAIAIAVYTGMRRGEIEGLTWSNIDLAAGVIYVGKTKTKRPRTVPIHSQLRPMLEDAKGSGRLFKKDSLWRSAEAVREAFTNASVPLPDGVDVGFHSLRHTWRTRLGALGARADVVQLVGWGANGNSVMDSVYLAMPVSVLSAEIEKLWWPKTSGTNPPQTEDRENT